jgi:Mg-chelatase subunit ChlD
MRTALLLVGLLLSAQQLVFRSGIQLVRIPVSLSQGPEATTSADALTTANFVVFEDGVEQQVSLFERQSVPVRICILLDISHSILEPRAARLSTGAYGHVVTLLAPSDEVSVVTFAMNSSVAVPWTAADKAAGMQLRLKSQGGTAIIDAVRTALRQIDKSKPGRPLILVITDGGE